MISNYMDLRIWQLGIQIVKEIYKIVENFPKLELFGLTSQARRAAVSIPANIAEGFCRLHRKEYVQFLSISLGSCAELKTHLFIGKELGYLTEDKCSSLSDLLDQESKQIRSLISKIESQYS